METVSIVIPVLNEAACMAQAIERAWATGPLEVIVVDGGSRDATPEIAAAERCVLLQSPAGRAIQQNLGASQARGSTLLFLHADTWLDSDGVRQIERAMQNRGAGIGGFEQRIEADGFAYRLLERGNAWRARRRGLVYGDQGLFIRRELFNEIGGFPAVSFLEDWLLTRRLRRRCWPVLLPGPIFVSARRWQRRGIVRQTLTNWTILAAATLGARPEHLARFYRHER